MSKDAKTKAPKEKMTLEEAEKQLPKLKKVKGDAYRELSGFRLKNKYKKDVPFKDKKVQKEYEALEETYKKAKVEYEKVEKVITDLQPPKERNTKYTYPAECNTPELKKKYRAQQRAASKKDEKADKKAEKKSKKDAGEKTSSKKAEEKTSKKSDEKPASKKDKGADKKADKKSDKKKAKKQDD